MMRPVFMGPKGAPFRTSTTVSDGFAGPTRMRRLSASGIEQLIGLVAGEGPPPGAATALHRRTGGDPSQVLIHLLGGLCAGRSLQEGLAGVADDGSTVPAPAPGTFRHEGDFWTLAYAGRSVLVRGARGLHYLVPLLRAPGCPIHVRDLIPIEGAGTGGADLDVHDSG